MPTYLLRKYYAGGLRNGSLSCVVIVNMILQSSIDAIDARHNGLSRHPPCMGHNQRLHSFVESRPGNACDTHKCEVDPLAHVVTFKRILQSSEVPQEWALVLEH